MIIARQNRNTRALFGFVLFLFQGFVLVSCSENDDVAPIITMNAPDTVYHVLNELYNDPGATATDETDGNITGNIYIDNQVDEDRIGEYSVTYSVVDKAGNEAAPVSRVVFVYNTGGEFYGNYDASEQQIFPEQLLCSYPTYLWVDSTVNNRVVFLDFGCATGYEVYADIYDSVLVMPYQLIQDSLVNMSFQGSGTISDSLIVMEYTKIDTLSSSFWNAQFTRIQ